VRAALVPGDSVRIMLHYSQGGSAAGAQWFFDHISQAGVPYDLIGLSYYPWWHGTIGAMAATVRTMAARYNRDVIVVETSYPWRAGAGKPSRRPRADDLARHGGGTGAVPARRRGFDVGRAAGHGLGVICGIPRRSR